MVFTQHVTDTGGRFLKGLVGGQAAFVHGVQNPAVNGFQTVPDVGQSAPNDNGHGVFNIGLLHFVHQIALGDDLIRETDVLGFVTAVMCQMRHLHLKYAAQPQCLPLWGRWLAEGETDEGMPGCEFAKRFFD